MLMISARRELLLPVTCLSLLSVTTRLVQHNDTGCGQELMGWGLTVLPP